MSFISYRYISLKQQYDRWYNYVVNTINTINDYIIENLVYPKKIPDIVEIGNELQINWILWSLLLYEIVDLRSKMLTRVHFWHRWCRYSASKTHIVYCAVGSLKRMFNSTFLWLNSNYLCAFQVLLDGTNMVIWLSEMVVTLSNIHRQPVGQWLAWSLKRHLQVTIQFPGLVYSITIPIVIDK